MAVIMLTIGAIIVNLLLVLGLMMLPPVGIASAENIFALTWLTFGVVVNLAFIRGAGIFERQGRKDKKQEKRRKQEQY
ncbi:MAG TPA: hypothetical protein GX697_02135 [Firmicutes bacterium]|nr:hypothetical protein [Bacillota bacterium]